MAKVELTQQEKWYAENLAFLCSKKMPVGVIILLACIPVIGWIILWKRKRPITEHEYDNRVNEQVEKTKRKAYEFLGIEKSEVSEVEPIVFNNYTRYRTNYRRDFAGRTLLKYNEEERFFRASDYQTTFIAFSSTEVFVYQCSISMIEPSIYKRSFEYFFSDILTVEIEHSKYTENTLAEEGEKKKLFGNKGSSISSTKDEIEFDCFRILTKAGNEGFTAVFKNTPEVRASIHGMKNLIREKRNSLEKKK